MGPLFWKIFTKIRRQGILTSNWGGHAQLSFSRPVAESDDEALRLILAEVEMLRPWYNLSLEERGRTTFGLLGLEITQLIKFLTEFLVGTPKNPREDLTVGEVFRFACEDIKMWYLESATAKSNVINSREVVDWFWGETEAGKLFLDLCPKCLSHEDSGVRNVAKSQFVPRAQKHRLV